MIGEQNLLSSQVFTGWEIQKSVVSNFATQIHATKAVVLPH